MTSESSFDNFTDTIASDSHLVSILSAPLSVFVLRIQGLHLSYDLDFFTLEDETLSHDIFGPSPLPQVPPFLVDEYLPAFPQEVPPGRLSTSGVIQNHFHSLQTSNESSIIELRTTVTPPHNAVRDSPSFLRQIHSVESIRFYSLLRLPIKR